MLYAGLWGYSNSLTMWSVLWGNAGSRERQCTVNWMASKHHEFRLSSTSGRHRTGCGMGVTGIGSLWAPGKRLTDHRGPSWALEGSCATLLCAIPRATAWFSFQDKSLLCSVCISPAPGEELAPPSPVWVFWNRPGRIICFFPSFHSIVKNGVCWRLRTAFSSIPSQSLNVFATSLFF